MITAKNKNIWTYIVLIIIIILQITRIIYNFFYLKDSYYVDEIWSYGLANSYYEPYIYQDADEINMTHLDNWYSSAELNDYMTVSSKHRFDYKSVNYNQSKDLHPPLYYIILHTICSFSPERFSPWQGLSINFFQLQ